MNEKIEILAPAGSYEGMKAAMNAGCDAVYIGGSSFGARAYANNLEETVLLQAIDEAHIRGKKLYLTVNTLIKEKERTQQLYRFMETYYRQGLDAVIVQDVGVMHFIHKYFPEIPIHASTQTTLTMAQGTNLLKATGVTRLVTARELSLREIKEIRENTDLEIETFVHGALCYCYSGQCLMSSMLGGRSGNRGRCAQPCRMPYQFYSEEGKVSSEQEKYLLSPKDINTVALIPELVEAGINSFKIEGRMKKPEYTAAVSAIYRKYTDYYLINGKDKYKAILQSKEYETDMTELMDIYNRGGFSEGYGKTYNGKSMMSLFRPNHSGVYVGEVSSVKGSQVSITLKEEINAQDILDIRSNEEEGYEFTVKDAMHRGQILTTNVGRRPLPQSKDNRGSKIQERKGNEPIIRMGAKVYRTRNNLLLSRISSKYLEKDQRQVITGYLKAKLGERLELTIYYRDCAVTAYQPEVQAAMKQPMSKEKLIAPLLKTGESPYDFTEIEVDMDEGIFVPVAWLNEIRRDAISQLQEKVADTFRRDMPERASMGAAAVLNQSTKDAEQVGKDEVYPRNMGLCIGIQTMEQFRMALSIGSITSIYVDYDTIDHSKLADLAVEARNADKELYLVLPHICRLSVYQRLKKDILSIIDVEGIKGFLVKNFEEIELLQSLLRNDDGKKIILNYNMYIYNREAKEFWNETGITHFTAPVELNFQELRTLGVMDCDFIVYGYLPLMVSAQCLFESSTGCRKSKSVDGNASGHLVDRLGKKFFVQTNCDGCYNIIYNGQRLSLYKQAPEIRELHPRNIRMDFTMESAEEMNSIIAAFHEMYFNNREVKLDIPNNTAGHFNRGVE